MLLSTYGSPYFRKTTTTKTLNLLISLAFYPIFNLLYSISPNSTHSILLILDLTFENADNHVCLEILSCLGIRLGQNSTVGTYHSFPDQEPSCHILSDSNFFFLSAATPSWEHWWQNEYRQISLTFESFANSASLRIKCKLKTLGQPDCYEE